jgi:CRISPR-associated protein Cas5d
MVDLKVWGEYACFTRPEFKVERVSYPVITPSAARGVLEAIYWKPQMRYRISEIGVLKFGSQTSILRNEISDRQSSGNGTRGGPFTVEGKRQQRSSLILQDVSYRIRAWIDVRPGTPHGAGKHLACFNRRAERGECFQRPFLGCREFAADFEPATDADVPLETLNISFGVMLFDIAYVQTRGDERADMEFYRHSPASDLDDRKTIAGTARPLMFEASTKAGWLLVPQNKYSDLDRAEGRKWVS